MTNRAALFYAMLTTLFIVSAGTYVVHHLPDPAEDARRERQARRAASNAEPTIVMTIEDGHTVRCEPVPPASPCEHR